MEMPRTPEPFSDDLHPHIRAWREACGIVHLPDEEVLRARTAYWALVTRLDRMVGQILEALRANGLEENTLIVYTSDHGEQVGEHGLWWKQTFYEDSVRVPAILSWPGHLPEGARCGRVCSALDLNATMLDARGRSVLPVLTSPDTADWEDIAFSEFCLDAAGSGGPFTEDGVRQRMVRRGDWKLNYYDGQPCQLFNLADDPREIRDRADDPQTQEVRDELTTLVLDGWDPKAVCREMARLRAERPLLAAWARHVQPADQYRWDLRPEMDSLD
jgi:choline-sulfatase